MYLLHFFFFKTKFCIFIKLDKSFVPSLEVYSYQQCTPFTWHLQHLYLSMPGLFGCLHFLQGDPILANTSCPLPLVPSLLALQASQAWLWFCRSRVTTWLCDRLCGLFFTLSLSPLVSYLRNCMNSLIQPLGRKTTICHMTCSSRYTLDEFGTARRSTVVRGFIDALTRGGPGGTPRPIEMHSHDPLRYSSRAVLDYWVFSWEKSWLTFHFPLDM